MTNDALAAEDVTVGYDERLVLRGATLLVGRGEVVALIGRNGSGKSTFLKAIYGLVPMRFGAVSINGEDIKALSPSDRRRAGLGYLGQGKRVFSGMTVRENLWIAGSITGVPRADLSVRIAALFPQLQAKLNQLAGTLSGGERQMLGIANVAIGSPDFLLLDEPSLGLAPIVARQALDQVRRVCDQTGAGCVVVEHKVQEVLRIADRVYAAHQGTVSFLGTSTVVARDDALLRSVYA